MTLSVLDAAKQAPEKDALVIGNLTLSFSDLAQQVRAVIAWLEARNLPTADGQPVAVIGDSRLGTLELVYALIELGQVVALLHPRLTAAEREPLLGLFAPDRVLDPGAIVHERPQQDAVRALPNGASGLAVVFTSGTTGNPKGVVLSRSAFMASARASEQNIGVVPDDRWLLGLPIAHVGGLSILTRCLMARRTVVVPSEVVEGRRLDAAGIATAVEEHRVTLASFVPTQLEWLVSMDPPWRPPARLRAILLGGAPARPALLERAADLELPVLTTYGLTEACSQVTTQPYGSMNRGELGSGRPLDGTEVRIADGTIEIRGPTLLSGLFPDRGKPVLDRDGWFRTDDLGRFDDRGMLHVLGRRSDGIITGGENVFPLEIESVLERCPAVAAACVFGVSDATWGEVVAVAIVPWKEPDHDAIAAFVREHFSSHRRPRLAAFIPELSMNEAGKIDRRATAALARKHLRPLDNEKTVV